MRLASLCAGLMVLVGGSRLWADQVELQNGDRYVGKVVLLTGDTLVLQSDVLGRVQLPRGKIAQITFGPVTAPGRTVATVTNSSAANGQFILPTAAGQTNAELAAAFKQLGAGTNLAQQVQKQFLADAGPEANQKFNELLSGVMNGSVSMNDLRAQAKSAADQVRALRKDVGEEAGPMLDGYLEILDKFLAESAAGGSLTNMSGLR